MTAVRYVFAFSRRRASESLSCRCPSSIRGRRECRGRAAPAVSYANGEGARMSIQAQRRHPASPAQRLYGLCRALPGDEFVLSPSSADASDTSTRSGQTCHRRLGTSNGCQDHTVLPYARNVVRPARLAIAHEDQPALRPRLRADALASTTSRTTFVTIAIRPSCRNGTNDLKPLIWGRCEAQSCPSCHCAAALSFVIPGRATGSAQSAAR